ncbi:MAG TPA: anti-sigma factor [Bacteroidia bacterium]|nr:anti-sigma factor [Bacteroidia bacterium]
MTPQELIGSGILEAYATGCATREEITLAEEMLASSPEVRAELAAIRETLEKYASLHAAEPPAGTEEKILAAVGVSRPAPKGKVITLEARLFRRLRNFAAAASLFVIFSAVFSLLMYFEKSNKAEENDALVAQLNRLQSDYDSTSNMLNTAIADRDQVKHEMSMLRDPMTETITLKSMMKEKPSIKAMVHWNKNDMMVAVDPMTLPPTPSGMQYELWAIVDNKPQSVDVFSVKENPGISMLIPVQKADAFAITLEKEGGTTVPTGQMYVMGHAGSTNP